MTASGESSRKSALTRVYESTVLRYPWLVVLVVVAIAAFFISHVPEFKLDASSDSIVLERDEDLLYYSKTRELFGSDDYVFVSVTPEKDLFSEKSLARLAKMRDDFAKIPQLEQVTTLLDVPLFHSPKVPLLELATGYKTLESPDVDLNLARNELINSPFYRDHLISDDGTTTNMQLTFVDPPQRLNDLYNRRAELNDKAIHGGLNSAEKRELRRVSREYDVMRAERMEDRQATIDAIRAVIDENRDWADIHLGGVPMIMVDVIDYVRSDIIVFGILIVAFIVVMLALIFREIRWVVVPTLTCVLVVVGMVGYLGWKDWRTTIVTSNFTSLLLVISLATTVHIVVRFREIYAGNPLASKKFLVLETVRHVALPCLYMVLTTIVGFGSLIVSGIRPVMDFGLMMAIGLTVTYFMCFIFMPALLLVMPRGDVPPFLYADLSRSPMSIFARITERRGWTVFWASIALFVFCTIGASRLKVENRFIDYFKKSTEIYRGMSMIDERLGGTTPLEVVIEAPEGSDKYWLEPENLMKLREVHKWLEDLPETGKVISPDTLLRILEGINNNNPVPKVMITMGVNMLPPDIKYEVVRPYITDDFNQVRISMRVRESDKKLNRKELIERIHAYFDSGKSPIPPGDARATGMFVLYNNLLQSLKRSQIETIGAVFAAIWVSFLILFRSPTLATIAIIPNIVPTALVLGTLGWLGVPLDIMTITIAAITMGIAVDDTIHYIHRFKEEFPKDRNYIATMYRCHNSIGRAIWITSVTIIAGFSVLLFSHFIPNVYFGLFTGIAMIVALAGCLLLLPFLIIKWKPFGKEAAPADEFA